MGEEDVHFEGGEVDAGWLGRVEGVVGVRERAETNATRDNFRRASGIGRSQCQSRNCVLPFIIFH